MKNIFLLILLLLIPSNTFSEAPQEYKIRDEEVRVSVALSILDSIESSLKEFRDMTELFLNDNILNKLHKKGVTQFEISQDEINKFSNIDWSTQNIGFHNWIVDSRRYSQ